MRLPNASSASVPTIACSGTPAWRVRVPISPTSLPSSVCSSSLPSPVTTARDGAHARVEVERVEDHGAPGSSVGAEGGPQPARQPAGGAGHRHAARVAREPAGQLVEALARAAPPSPGPRPSAGRTPRRALPRRAHVAQHDDPRAAAARRRPRSPRARRRRRRSWPSRRPPTSTTCAPASTAARDQLAGAVGDAAQASRSSSATSAEPGRRRHLHHRGPAVLDQGVAAPRPRARAGPRTSRGGGLAAQREQQRLHRPLAAVGDRAGGRAAPGRRARARARSPRPPRRRGTCP